MRTGTDSPFFLRPSAFGLRPSEGALYLKSRPIFKDIQSGKTSFSSMKQLEGFIQKTLVAFNSAPAAERSMWMAPNETFIAFVDAAHRGLVLPKEPIAKMNVFSTPPDTVKAYRTAALQMHQNRYQGTPGQETNVEVLQLINNNIIQSRNMLEKKAQEHQASINMTNAQLQILEKKFVDA